MADANAQADIRGLDVNKIAKGFADEALVLKRSVRVSKTAAREIRWYKKTAGYLDSPDTSGITDSLIANTSSKSIAPVTEASWTRQTSYVRKYFAESPWLSEEDIKDSDPDILATNIGDIGTAVANQVETRIYNVLADVSAGAPAGGGNVPTGAAAGTGWDDTSGGDPIGDLLDAKASIRSYRYQPEGAVCYIDSTDHKNLVKWLINTKGSSIPEFASERIRDGVVMGLLGLKIVVSENATTDYALVFVPNKSCAYKEFMPMSSAVMKDPGIGRKIRVWEEGEALLEHPNSVYVITDTQT